MRRLAVLGTAFLLAACHGGTRSDAPLAAGPGRPPQEVAKDLFVCPGGYGWTGYTHVVYAPNDAAKPAADVRPDRCFASLDEAMRAGFRLTPPPPGGFLIDTIYLVPPDPAILPMCQEAARRLRIRILCPKLAPGDSNSLVDCDQPGCVYVGAMAIQFTFSGPPGYVGIPNENGNHLFVLEARAGRERTAGFLGCPGGLNVGSVAVRGRTGSWVRCPGGSTMNSGHVMLVWTEHGVRYAVSLHSDTFTNRVLAAAVAGGLEPITPAGR